jgi:mono/diheme cytochrome c family protein
MSDAPKPPYPKWVARSIAAGVIAFAVGFTAFAYWFTRPQPPRAALAGPEAPRSEAAGAEAPRTERSSASGIFAKKPDPAFVALGKTVYDQQCASCHGANLEGQPNWRRRLPNGRMPAAPHDDSGHTWHHPERVLFGIVKHGVVPPYAPPGYQSDMPAFKDTLSDEEIRAVLAFIGSRWSPEVLQWRKEALAAMEAK